jgi:hypothetical protein
MTSLTSMIYSSVVKSVALAVCSYVCWLNALQCVAAGKGAEEDATPSRKLLLFIDDSVQCVEKNAIHIALFFALSAFTALRSGATMGAAVRTIARSAME